MITVTVTIEHPKLGELEVIYTPGTWPTREDPGDPPEIEVTQLPELHHGAHPLLYDSILALVEEAIEWG